MAAIIISFLLLSPFFLLVQSEDSAISQNSVFAVTDYGAIGNGIADDTQGFKDAWEAACRFSGSSSTIHVPAGRTFLLKPITFGGPCKANQTNFLIDGDLTAPSDPHEWNCEDDECQTWIGFENFDGLFIYGSGTINGRGANWWPLTCQHDKLACKRKPTGLVVGNSKNVHIYGLTFMDSPNMHVAIEGSRRVCMCSLKILADKDSPNTDGIHIQESRDVFVSHSQISTGDDCISMGDGASHISINDIHCGPGHGISIGSLGRNGQREVVENVYVRNVTFTRTMNGARIKTWQGGKGHVRNVIFEHVTSVGSQRPIVIDQYYCPHAQCQNRTSAVEISDITYKHVHGTAEDEPAIDLACSETVPCKNIWMEDIELRAERRQHGGRSKEDDRASSYCLNARGSKNGKIVPSVPCLD